MAKQILVGIEEQNLNEVAHYLVIYFPYNEEMCSYTDDWLGELYENKYPLVSKGMWSGIIDLKVHKLLDWKPEYGTLYLEVTKRVYSIGNERVLVAHYGNRLRISKLSTALFFCALRNLQRTLRMQR